MVVCFLLMEAQPFRFLKLMGTVAVVFSPGRTVSAKAP